MAPNAIDWNFVFSNADFFKNPTLYIAEMVIVVTYILAMIWARRQDKQDIEKVSTVKFLNFWTPEMFARITLKRAAS